jgi:hypothetical protein
MYKRPRLRFVSTELSPTAIEDVWLRRATAAAIDEARNVVSAGVMPPMTPIGRLSDVEWGWIVAGILFGWIRVRAEQATNTSAGIENSIRSLCISPDPWDLGAISAILPELADGNSVDWSKPLVALSKDEMLAFLNDALTLTVKAMAARDRAQGLVTRRLPASDAEAEVGAPAFDELPDDLSIPDDLSVPGFLRRSPPN